MRTLTACAAALGVWTPAQAANPCYDRTLDMAKTVGHAHGLMEASRIVSAKIDANPERAALIAYDIATALHHAALAKQAEADRQMAALLADGCR